MISNEHIDALRIISNKLNGKGIVWALTGSASFFIQGMDVVVHDIDIQTDKVGAFNIEKELLEYSVESVKYWDSSSMRSYFGKLNICDIEVEIMGDIQKKHEDEWERINNLSSLIHYVEFDERLLPVLDLSYEAVAYKKIGRIERANKIEEFINSNNYMELNEK